MARPVKVAASFERSEPLPGVRLVTERMPYLRSAAIGAWVEVGSRDEPEEVSGSSHLLEHLLFKGTERRSARDIAEAFDAIGGELNAYSAKEHTCYYCRVLDSDVEMAVDVLADMIEHARLEPEDVEAERKVVLEEIRMNADTPDDQVHDMFEERAWPGHPLGRPITGTEQSVGAIERERLLEFYDGAYAPGRLVIAAAGNVEHDQLAGLVGKAFEGRRKPAGSRSVGPPPAIRPGAWYQPKMTEQVHIVWGSQGLPRGDPDRYALAVLNALYGTQMSSRLFQEIRERRGLCYSIFSYHHLYLETGLYAVYMGTSEAAAPEVLRITREQAALCASGDAGDQEVERAKGHVKGGLVLSMDDPGGRMSRLGLAELLDHDIPRVDELLDRVDAVTLHDVARVAKRVFLGSEQVLSCIGPMAEGALDDFVEPLDA